MAKFTPQTILTLPPGRHGDGDRLYVEVRPGSASWVFRYQVKGRPRNMGLGVVDVGKLADSLATARQKAAECRRLLSEGVDPLEHRKAEKAAQNGSGLTGRKTFAEAAEVYVATHQASWRSSAHIRQWRTYLDRHILPRIGRIPVADVGANDVRRVLEPLWRTRPEIARKTCGKIGLVLHLAIASEWRSAGNPASVRVMKTLLGPLPQTGEHHPALSWKDAPGLLRRIEHRRDAASQALQWIMLTGVRSAAGRGARWGEIDMAGKVWTVPVDRNLKTGQPHRVPLSLAALAVLESVHRRADCPFVFPGQSGRKAVSETSVRNILRSCGIDKDTACIHGFRSTLRDYLADNGIDDNVAESCIGHLVASQVVRAYRRTTFEAQRRDAMERWGVYLS